MKTKILILPLVAALAFTQPVSAAEKKHDPSDHSHETKKVAGPNGGRIITSVTPHAEFFVTDDRKVKITFLDDAGKPIDPGQQVVTVTAGDRLSPTKMGFAKSGQSLVSDAVLPDGDGVPAVVQIKDSPSGKIVTERINVDLSKCPECKKAEYACVCH